MLVWWGWMLALIYFLERPDLKIQILRDLLLYIMAPLPIMALFAHDVRRLKGFALAYVFTTLLGGFVSLAILNVSFVDFFRDASVGTRLQFLGLDNYHYMGHALAISLILLAAFYQESKAKYLRLFYLLTTLCAVYFAMLVGSRQAIFSVSVVFGLFAWTRLRSRKANFWALAVLFGLVVFLGYFMFREDPKLVLRSSGSLDEAAALSYSERWELWMQGLGLFASSPVWGLGFAKSQVAHNIFIGVLADQGVVGLILFIGLMVFFVRMARRVQGEPTIWGTAFLYIGFYALIHSQFSGNVLGVWELYWSSLFLWCLSPAGSKQSRGAYPVVAAPGLEAGNRYYLPAKPVRGKSIIQGQ
jgi:O-antigen ligase